MVTGAAGFIGRHVVDELAAEGWAVRALDLEMPGASVESERGGASPVEWSKVDIRDEAALEPLLGDAEVVVHLASAHLQHRAPPGWYESVNVDGTRNLVGLAAAAGVRRFVHVSSVGIYGHVSDPPADEDAPKHPTNDYERTKLLGETAALELSRDVGMELVVLRPAWVYGSGCPRTARLLRTVRRGRFFYVGAGANLRHPVHVSDAVRAILLAIDAPSASTGQPYLVVGPEAASVRQLVETCARVQGVRPPRLRLPRALVASGLRGVELGFALLGKAPPVSRRSLAFFEHDNAFDGAAAARDLGFEPRVGLEAGLQMTLRPPLPAAVTARNAGGVPGGTT
ncbi:NAD-dependent epimerase/dehydratase family protein [soil metagenome]